MELVGFNARQVAEGMTKRGEAHRKTKKKQGPLTPQCLADNISKLSREQMERLFTQMVRCVVGWGLLDGERTAALDGSKLETPKTYAGCGKLKQTRSVKIKGQKERATEEYSVYGWKVLVLIDVETRLPLASDPWCRFRSMKGAGSCRSWSRPNAIWGRMGTFTRWWWIAAISMGRICGRCTSSASSLWW